MPYQTKNIFMATMIQIIIQWTTANKSVFNHSTKRININMTNSPDKQSLQKLKVFQKEFHQIVRKDCYRSNINIIFIVHRLFMKYHTIVQFAAIGTLRKQLIKWPAQARNDSEVHIFLEGHKILRNLPLTFDYSTYSQK